MHRSITHNVKFCNRIVECSRNKEHETSTQCIDLNFRVCSYLTIYQSKAVVDVSLDK